MSKKQLTLLLVIFTVVFLWSGIKPKDYFTWFLEVLPAILGVIVLTITFKKFQFTPMLYWLILIHCCILMIGGHYTYAEVPLFDWIKEVLHQSRNNYDKVGHFAQGFVPAMITREILLRQSVINSKGWLRFLVVCVSLTISVVYEFIEWWVALLTGEDADSFLGTQGYLWDTQSDMLYAAIGAITALIALSSLHNKELNRLSNQTKN